MSVNAIIIQSETKSNFHNVRSFIDLHFLSLYHNFCRVAQTESNDKILHFQENSFISISFAAPLQSFAASLIVI